MTRKNYCMKKIVQLIIIGTVFFHLNAFSQIKEIDIKGKWVDKELQVEYTFANNGIANFSQMGYGMTVAYKIDASKFPYWIDFTLKRGGNKMKMPGLLKVINKDTIWIEQFTPYSKHPKEFSKDFISRTRKIHVLVRKKP